MELQNTKSNSDLVYFLNFSWTQVNSSLLNRFLTWNVFSLPLLDQILRSWSTRKSTWITELLNVESNFFIVAHWLRWFWLILYVITCIHYSFVQKSTKRGSVISNFENRSKLTYHYKSFTMFYWPKNQKYQPETISKVEKHSISVVSHSWVCPE